jgi:hypothetical protein
MSKILTIAVLLLITLSCSEESRISVIDPALLGRWMIVNDHTGGYEFFDTGMFDRLKHSGEKDREGQYSAENGTLTLWYPKTTNEYGYSVDLDTLIISDDLLENDLIYARPD